MNEHLLKLLLGGLERGEVRLHLTFLVVVVVLFIYAEVSIRDIRGLDIAVER